MHIEEKITLARSRSVAEPRMKPMSLRTATSYCALLIKLFSKKAVPVSGGKVERRYIEMQK